MHKNLGILVLHIPLMFQGPSIVDNPNCPEQALSMVELVRLPPQTEENIYCPGPFQVEPFTGPFAIFFCKLLLKIMKIEVFGLYSHNF